MEVFDDLISAIQEAVVQAHQTSENQHLRLMDRFFEQDSGQPQTLKLILPYIDPAKNEVKYREVEIPKICLVPFNSIRIKDIEVSAEVELQDIKPARGLKRISARLGGRKANKAKVKVRVEGGDPPEALMKLNDTLVKILP